MGDESAHRGRCRKVEAVYIYINPYEITIIEGPNLVFIPKFEEGGKLFVTDESGRLGLSINFESPYIGRY
jgi:hypothetical protein